MGWFYGFKLQLAIDDCGELLGCYLTPGNVDDRRPVPHMVRALWGKLFGDKGYISQPLSALLHAQGLQLVTRLKKNLKNRFLPLCDRLLLRKRALVETVNGQLENISQVEHTRHRSLWNFPGNVAAALIAYTWREKQPSLNIHLKEPFQISN